MNTQPSKPAHAEATPRPWRLGPQHRNNTVAIHATSASVFHLTPFGSSEPEAHANAALIVEAVNAHGAAVALAEAVLDNLRGFVTESDIDEVLRLARAFEAARKGEA